MPSPCIRRAYFPDGAHHLRLLPRAPESGTGARAPRDPEVISIHRFPSTTFASPLWDEDNANYNGHNARDKLRTEQPKYNAMSGDIALPPLVLSTPFIAGALSRILGRPGGHPRTRDSSFS